MSGLYFYVWTKTNINTAWGLDRTEQIFDILSHSAIVYLWLSLLFSPPKKNNFFLVTTTLEML